MPTTTLNSGLLQGNIPAQVRLRLTILNLRSDQIEQLVSIQARHLPTLEPVLRAMRDYEHDPASRVWDLRTYSELCLNLPKLQTELALVNAGPTFKNRYREAINYTETCQDIAIELVKLLTQHPEFTTQSI